MLQLSLYVMCTQTLFLKYEIAEQLVFMFDHAMLEND